MGTNKTRFKSLSSLLMGKTDSPTLKTQLAQQFGRTQRGTPDYGAAADQLGVSTRTLRRWAAAGAMPEKSPKAKAAASTIDAWRNSPQGREQLMGTRRANRLAGGFKVKVNGIFIISDDKRGRRDVRVDVDPDHAQSMVDAHIMGDDRTVSAAFDDAASNAFGGSVHVDIHDIRFEGK